MMCVNQKEFDELLSALDRSLAIFGDKPTEPGFDLAVYEELKRVRETLIRARRDMQDPNVKARPMPAPETETAPKPKKPKRDSKSPLGA